MQKVNYKNQLLKFFICGLFLSFSVYSVKAGSVALSATPTLQTVTVGQNATYMIKINCDGYADKVTLKATGLPSGATATFAPNTTTAGSSVLTVKTLTTTLIGTFNITVKGTANGITIAPITIKLTTKPLPSIAVSVTPSTQFIVAGQATSYEIAISRFNYDGKLTLSAQNLPSGVTALFEPESTYGNSSRMYLYSNGLPFIWKDYGMLVRAQNLGDGIDKLVPVQLRVNYGIIWAAQFAAPNNQAVNPDFATDVTYDSAGNIYVTGYTYDIVTEEEDSWVAKFDSAGNQLWLSMIPGLLEDMAKDVFVDEAGNVYVAGSARFQRLDIFVAKFNASGTQTSPVSLFGTPNDEGQSGMQFGVNVMGETILTAATRVRIYNTGPRDTQNNPATTGNFDVTRYTFDANFNRTSINIVVDGAGEPKDLAVGNDGSIYVLSEDRSQLGGGLTNNYVISNSQVEKFNGQNGQSIYRSLPVNPPGAEAAYANRLKIDATANVFAVGSVFYSTGAGVLQFSNAWLVKLDSSGARTWWVEPYPNVIQTEILALDIDAVGNIICAGSTWGSLRGRNPNEGGPGNATARPDAWFGKYSKVTGNEMSASQFNVDDKDIFTAVKVGATGTTLNSTLYFAGTTVFFKNVNFGYEDALLLRCSSQDCGYIP